LNRQLGVKRMLRLAVTLAVLAPASATVAAAQPDGPDRSWPEAGAFAPYARRYYGSVDPNPIGYYPYRYYQGPAFPTQRAIGYYPYPNPHPYAAPFPYGYYGSPYGYYGGYGAWPFYGYPGWGWGSIGPFGFGF
jgi:hypothetical protein